MTTKLGIGDRVLIYVPDYTTYPYRFPQIGVIEMIVRSGLDERTLKARVLLDDGRIFHRLLTDVRKPSPLEELGGCAD